MTVSGLWRQLPMAAGPEAGSGLHGGASALALGTGPLGEGAAVPTLLLALAGPRARPDGAARRPPRRPVSRGREDPLSRSAPSFTTLPQSDGLLPSLRCA